LLVTGFAAGAIPMYAANRILLKSASVIGIRAGEAARHDPALREREMQELSAWANAGKIRPYVSATFPLAQVAEAMDTLAQRRA
ncbi:zinc-binding dehydrogenase, partial [Salmonella enterica]|uniref:zinc-binding dehydrogenase n=1 Tax=Salmonella enterica TaxID=28901 RepID=UPI003D2C9590